MGKKSRLQRELIRQLAADLGGAHKQLHAMGVTPYRSRADTGGVAEPLDPKVEADRVGVRDLNYIAGMSLMQGRFDRSVKLVSVNHGGAALSCWCNRPSDLGMTHHRDRNCESVVWPPNVYGRDRCWCGQTRTGGNDGVTLHFFTQPCEKI
jgi:hypothetical protein